MFEELVEKLENCGHVQYEADAYSIRILPTTPVGFPVMIEWIWDTHFAVLLDGWRQELDSYEDAVTWFTLAASGAYRLKTRSKGHVRFRWTLEYWDGCHWVEGTTQTDLFYPFWKPTVTNYQRNDLHCHDTTNVSHRHGTYILVPEAEIGVVSVGEREGYLVAV